MARETFSRSMNVSADPDSIWTTLTNIDRVPSWLSVVGSVEEVDRLTRYTAVLEDRLGPFALRADLDISVNELDIGRSISFHAEGEDRQVSSRITVDAVMALETDETSTAIHVDGVYDVAGRVATLGSSTIRSKAAKILHEFFLAAENELSS